ncbi:glucosamine-6-phosphate deaminase [Aequitasia blattaphilus]|uniref:Glucosamine-6-phosphate deaminase n=1 Tax=Aequitasia blattaphilus TaxID=2949332 RepID=A0ABT1EA43_9FIRM|nr:glucosamine-6-phosphate deaminase [Aequitasia blattaphilus]MCP1102710.1 glucosamine-6-phosphate deaminase [Aequitasia blattaphilus]MCR8615350.1 glucosamine-6-phosphate deaminase [Aequitasia blattaphilus]
MVIKKVTDYEELSKKGAQFIAAQIIMKPNCVLGLATGGSPVGTYQRLIKAYQDGSISFKDITSVNLDEYKGLDGTHPQSYRYFMNTNLFDHVDIVKENTYLPDGLEPDSEKACTDYEAIIDGVGGIDLQLLGLGHNGHIGFNEPNTVFEKNTHCVELTQSTIDANTRYFNSSDEVPRQAYTMGYRGILSAKKILVLVSGSAKASILAQVVNGPITPEVPASILQLHPDVTIIADAEAAALL